MPAASSNGPRVGPHLWQVRWVRDLAILTAIAFLIWFGYYLRSIFTPVLIALFLAYVFDPLITWAEHRHNVKRPLTISLLLVAITLVLAGLVLWLGPIIVHETGQFIDSVPRYVEALAERLREHIDFDPGTLRETIQQRLNEYRQDPAEHAAQAVRWLFAGSGDVASFIQGVVGTVTYVALMLILIPFYFFFFAWHFGPMVRSVEQYIPVHHRQQTLHILDRMNKVVASYFRERVLIALMMAAMFCLGWWICGVPYALLLGLAAGLLSLIPYIGGIVWPVAVLMAYLNATSGENPPGFDWLKVVVWPSVVYGLVQFVEGWILTPWIQGKSMELSAVTILLVLFIGGAIGGLYGLILCIPIAACIKILAVELVLPRLKQWAVEH